MSARSIEVGVVDYGAGNIASVMKALDYAGADPERIADPEKLKDCERILLPGVGASGQAMSNIKEHNLDIALKEAVFEHGKPFMGICVGMQLLATNLHEYGHHKGLGWINANVISLNDHGISENPVPHMGWNETNFNNENNGGLENILGRNKTFYYCHSYTLVTPEEEKISCRAKYEKDIVAGVMFDNICGFQFHPEKSQLAGDNLMQWFIDWNP